jgi:hypothetical protein
LPQQSARPGIRALEALGLTVFLATAALLTALFLSRLSVAFDSTRTVAAAFSTLCAAVATFGMLVDAADLWMRGRKMTPSRVKRLRLLVFVAVLVSLVASMVGGNSLIVVLLAPVMIVYLFIARKRPDEGYAAATGSPRGGSGSGRTASAAPSKSRQRRGGKKRR